MVKIIVVVCVLFSTTFGFFDVYVGDGNKFIKKPNSLTIGCVTKYINLSGDKSIISSPYNIASEGLIVALNTTEYTKLGLSFYCGKNIDTSLVNANIDFTLNVPIPILSGVNVVTGLNIGAIGIEDNDGYAIYADIEPLVGLGINFSTNFSVIGGASIIYGELIKSQNYSSRNDTVNTSYFVMFKLSIL